jgi:hypothetical protein
MESRVNDCAFDYMSYTNIVRLTLEEGKLKLNSEEITEEPLTNEQVLGNLTLLVVLLSCELLVLK